MFKHLRPVWAEIDLDKLAYNMQQIKNLCKSKEIIAVVKADAYGHGALDIAPILLESGATRLAVAVLNEGIELRRGGIDAPIMVLGFTPDSLIETALKYNIEQTVYSYEIAKQISDVARKSNMLAKIHIALDTGMGRIGFLPSKESIEEISRLSKLPNIQIEGIFSHFASADEKDKTYTKLQFNKFLWVCNNLQERGIDIKVRHIANSAAIIDMPELHLEGVRPGIIMYGYYPSSEVNKERLDLKPVMSLKTTIVHIKNMEKGKYISYGREFKTEKESIIATLPVGYADGYNRSLYNKGGKVILKEQLAPLAGRVCMDQCMIDVSHIKDVKIGDEVILMGEDKGIKMTAEEIGNLLGTINYEVTCMISKRVPRVYIRNGNIVGIRNYV
ncbi:alanine racemase [Clostridium cochlearium]|uniref:Alanine racemase n=1 Tax=Clostridium cochlearium TaxID=1494 RepID=A0ABY0QP59_CLOCO|nr:alanine racemase [Clostridium cochlearium]MBV1820937.1 alanine racemase [Bacteroidales bacterium MSK.15.36]NSJ91342.1 alanine racemase [Coprococcus sp. MSK.21.13]MCG4570946.1 alanine racemase [Clostridium cochlearium]MCG4579656.1 alanine racemase [Clostridium cochlearium]MCR1971080.1 alanine racemase [Clostridium cochlearium]